MLGVERNRPSKVTVTYWYSFLPLSKGSVRQQLARGNKRQNKEELFQLLFIMQNLSKNQFLGVRKGPPHAGIAKLQYSMHVAFTYL